MNMDNNGIIIRKENKKEQVKLLFAGDYCSRNGVEKLLYQGKTSSIIEPIEKELEDKDLSIVNLEGAVTETGNPIIKSGPNIAMDPVSIEFVKKAGFDLVSLANNHIGDYGPEAVIETIEYLKKENMKYVGAGQCLQDSRQPQIVEKNNCKIGILAYAENEFGIAEIDKPGASPLDPLENLKEIEELSAKVDISVIYIHGGNEHNPIPSPRMVKTYRAFVDAGADVVVGNHTHCPQGLEIYNESVIIYSLGNFLFDKKDEYQKEDMWWKGYMARVSFNENDIVKLEIVPYNFGPDAASIKPILGKDKKDFINYFKYLSRIIKDEKMLNEFWYGWCALKGPSWLNFLEDIDNYPFDEEYIKNRLPGARNVFSCEAHNELMTTYLNMVHNNEVSKAEEIIPVIENLQKGKIPS